VTDNIICWYVWFIDLRLQLFIDLLSSRIKNDLLKLSERYRIGRLFWPILSTIGLSDFHTIILTPIATHTQMNWAYITQLWVPTQGIESSTKSKDDIKVDRYYQWVCVECCEQRWECRHEHWLTWHQRDATPHWHTPSYQSWCPYNDHNTTHHTMHSQSGAE